MINKQTNNKSLKRRRKKRKTLQIALLPRTAAIALTRRQIPQTDLPALDPPLVALQHPHRLLLRPPDLGLLPAARPPAVFVLDEQVGGPDLAVLGGGAGRRVGGGAVVQGHVGFDLVGVGAGGRFPAGLLGRGVEVVGEVLGVGVPDFPLRWEARVGAGGRDLCRGGGRRL